MDNYSKFLDFKIRGNMNGIRYPCLVDIKYDGITCVIADNCDETIKLQFNQKIGLKLDFRICRMDLNYPNSRQYGMYLAEMIHDDGKNGSLYKTQPQPPSIKIFDLLNWSGVERNLDKLEQRREDLLNFIQPQHLATSLICDNRQEVEDCFKNAVNNGYEGIVVKNLNETLEGQTWVKMKFEDEIELKISKVEDSRLETLHGNVVVGLGLNVVDVWQVGDIALVRHNGITNGGSLRNPRIVRKL